MAQIDTNKCLGCGICVDSCSTGAILMDNDKAVIDNEKCTNCGECVEICPQGVIAVNK
jgi:ferredoxin